MRISLSPLRPLAYLAIAAGLMVTVIDAGAVMLVRIKTPDDVRAAGIAAATAVKSRPVNADTARTAFDVATEESRPIGLVVKATSFTLYPDGRVSLTGTRTAPTLLLERVDALSDLAKVTASATVSPSPYS
jgi:hypothetical protein